MLTEKDYCDYDTCVALKELGYVGICDAYYELTGNEDYNRDSFELLYTRDFIHPDDIDRVAAPLLYQAQKWLREEKNIDISVTISPFEYFATIREFVFWRGEYSWKTPPIYPNGAKTYEEALSEGIKEAVKILTNKENE